MNSDPTMPLRTSRQADGAPLHQPLAQIDADYYYILAQLLCNIIFPLFFVCRLHYGCAAVRGRVSRLDG
jgi:hypothetical protein